MLCCETTDKGPKYGPTNRRNTPNCYRICSTHGSINITYASTTGCEDWGAKEAGDESEYQKCSEIGCQCDRKL